MCNITQNTKKTAKQAGQVDAIVSPDDSPDKYRAKLQSSFTEQLTLLINQHSQENGSNTPDFILAQYLQGCLKTFETAVQQRETWHGRDARPSHTRYGVELKA